MKVLCNNITYQLYHISSATYFQRLFTAIWTYMIIHIRKNWLRIQKAKHFTPFYQVRRIHKREMSSKRSTWNSMCSVPTVSCIEASIFHQCTMFIKCYLEPFIFKSDNLAFLLFSESQHEIEYVAITIIQV